MKHPVVLSAALAITALLASPSHAQVEGSQAIQFSAQVTDTMQVSVAFEDGRAVVFFCGDEQTVATETNWLSGQGTNNSRWWRLDSGDWTVWVAANDNYMIGALDRPGYRRTWFSGDRLLDPNLGLYRTVTPFGVAGGIVTDFDGDGELSLQGALKLPTGLFLQVVPLSPMVMAPDTIAVAVPVDAADDTDGIDDGLADVEIHAIQPAKL